MKKRLVTIAMIVVMIVSGVGILPSQSVKAADNSKPIYYAETNEDEFIAVQRALANHEENFTIRYLASKEDDFDYMAADVSDMSYESDGLYWNTKLYAKASYGIISWIGPRWDDDYVTDRGQKWKSIDYIYKYRNVYNEYLELYKGVRKLIIDSGIATKSDYEKAAWAYDWICTNIKYDESLKILDAYGTFINKKGVCNGYGKLFDVFAEELGLNSRYVTGAASGGNAWYFHAWNLVELDGKWYHLDTTWGTSWGKKYFLKGNNSFNTDHELADAILDSQLYSKISNSDCTGSTQNSGVPARLYNINIDPVNVERLNIGEEYNWLISNTTGIKLNFENSNPDVASLTDDGKVKALKAGKTTLTATNKELGIKQTIDITVSKEKATVSSTSSGYTTIKSADDISVVYSKKAPIKLTLQDKNGKLQGIKYASKDTTIATVDKNGNVSGIKAGTTNITITCDNGSKLTVKVTVKPLVNTKNTSVKVGSKISLRDAIVVSKNGYKDLKFTVQESNGTIDITTGKVKNSKTIVTVSSDGYVTGKSKGTATVEIYNKSTNKLLGTVSVTVK
ncbi:transglutaminase domain-containing protein [Anaerocolumna sp.]|uniref:transglutaminase domain-containing protein n=1 Tax=Anaerocolumna sp. TaxID=2041569 RepID=UPI0028AE7B16|nr:transglutaminase domain-containing protein [Anaerocolumna sp.]